MLFRCSFQVEEKSAHEGQEVAAEGQRAPADGDGGGGTAEKAPQSLDEQPRPEEPPAGLEVHQPRVLLPTDMRAVELPHSTEHFVFGGEQAWAVEGSKWTYVDQLNYHPPNARETRQFRQFCAVRAHTRSASVHHVDGRLAFVAVAPRGPKTFDDELIIFTTGGHCRQFKAAECVLVNGKPALTDAEAQEVVDTADAWIQEHHVSAAKKRATQRQREDAARGGRSLRNPNPASPSGSASASSPSNVKTERGQEQAGDVEPQLTLSSLSAMMQAQMGPAVAKATQPLSQAALQLSQTVVQITEAAAAFAHAQPQTPAQAPAETETTKRARTQSEMAAQAASGNFPINPQSPLSALSALPVAPGAIGPDASVLQLQALLGGQVLERAQLQAANLALQIVSMQAHARSAAPSTPASPSAAPASAAAPSPAASPRGEAAPPKQKSKRRRKY